MNKGLTLIELMISLALFGLGAAAGFQVFRHLHQRHKIFSAEARADLRRDTVLAWMARDFRQAYLSVEDKGTRFVGRHDELDFFLRKEEPRPIRYEWKNNSLERSVESERRTFLPQEVQSVKFEFFDGNAWRPDWGWDAERERPLEGIKGLPTLIRVRINDHESVFPVMTPLLNGAAEL